VTSSSETITGASFTLALRSHSIVLLSVAG
jgi:hypothetical protein